MSVVFSTVFPRTNSQIIVTQILRGLANGELREGEKLPSEIELCRAFGVSRSPVRDAVRVLVGMGRVKVIPGKGTFICCSLNKSSESGRQNKGEQ